MEPAPPSSRWPVWRGRVLAAVGGYLDTLGFLMLGGLFVNHVTGNIVIAAVRPGTESLPEIVMFPVFFAMAGLGAAVMGKADRRRPSSGVPLALATEAVFLGLFMVLGIVLFPEPGASGVAAEVLVGAAGVSAMAIQTVVTRRVGYQFPTNMVTGTMTVLGMDMAVLAFGLHSSADERQKVETRARENGWVVLSFIAGAVAAAVITSYVHF